LIERLSESHGLAYGFKVAGRLTAEDVDSVSQQIDVVLANHKGHLGLLADLTEMEGASWSARWDEMRFLQRHTESIAGMAVISNDDWQEVAEMILVATAALQTQTLYFHSSEMHHAWHLVKMNKMDERMPVRVLYPGNGLLQNYTPEYMGI